MWRRGWFIVYRHRRRRVPPKCKSFRIGRVGVPASLQQTSALVEENRTASQEHEVLISSAAQHDCVHHRHDFGDGNVDAGNGENWEDDPIEGNLFVVVEPTGE